MLVMFAFHVPQLQAQTIVQTENQDEFIAPSIGQNITATMQGHITMIEVKPSITMTATLYIFECGNDDYPIAVQKEIKFRAGENKLIELIMPPKIEKGKQYYFMFTNSSKSVVRFDGKRSNVYDGGPLVAYFDDRFEDFDMYFKIWETDEIILLGKK